MTDFSYSLVKVNFLSTYHLCQYCIAYEAFWSNQTLTNTEDENNWNHDRILYVQYSLCTMCNTPHTLLSLSLSSILFFSTFNLVISFYQICGFLLHWHKLSLIMFWYWKWNRAHPLMSALNSDWESQWNFIMNWGYRMENVVQPKWVDSITFKVWSPRKWIHSLSSLFSKTRTHIYTQARTHVHAHTHAHRHIGFQCELHI